MTTTADVTEGNPFCTTHDIVLGDYVRDRRGQTGRVYGVAFGEDDVAWLDMQSPPLTEEQRNEKRWLKVLVHNGGAIKIPASTATKLEPFVLRNDSTLFYFGER